MNFLNEKINTMKNLYLLFLLGALHTFSFAQDNPAINTWMINTTGITGSHYIDGNPTPVIDTAQANVQKVQYSDTYAYINCSGVPAYIIGPYLDGNPSLATNNDWLFKIALNPVEETGNNVSTPLGAIGVFINGVPMYNYADGASYDASSGSDDMMGGDGVWNRNAVLAENAGFDCAKGHPSPVFDGPPGPGGSLVGGSYHHHQNPTAFNLDLVQVSDVCDVYLSDGLYTIDEEQHSPLIGFAFDGFPVYGAYAYANTDGTGGIKRMESSYQLRDILVRTQYADGTNVTDGPDVSSSFPLGWYKEDFEFIEGSGDLDIHNGRFCVTPEYPDGIYAYFATVDENWNSAYPYMVGPTYFGELVSENIGGSVLIDEEVTLYEGTSSVNENSVDIDIQIGPNPTSNLLLIQVGGLLRNDLSIRLFNAAGQLVKERTLAQGSTICHLETDLLYSGEYYLEVSDGSWKKIEKVIIIK